VESGVQQGIFVPISPEVDTTHDNTRTRVFGPKIEVVSEPKQKISAYWATYKHVWAGSTDSSDGLWVSQYQFSPHKNDANLYYWEATDPYVLIQGDADHLTSRKGSDAVVFGNLG